MNTLQIIAIVITISITIWMVRKILTTKWNGNILNDGDYL